jgi:hypothetical protein
MSIYLWILLGIVIILAIVLPIILTRSSSPCKTINCGQHGHCENGECICTDGYSGKYCDKSPIAGFSLVKGANGKSGFCKAGKDDYPYFKWIENTTQDSCKELCNSDENCVAFNYNDTYKIGQLFSSTKAQGYDGPPSSTWKRNVGHYSSPKFPTYASPYICPDPMKYPLNDGGCRSGYPDLCTDNQDGWMCYVKGDSPNVSWWGPDNDPIPSGNTDDSKLQFLTSNPYIPSYLLLKTPGNFYYWFYHLIKNANKFLILCNAYIKLGIHRSEDPDDYQNQIYYALFDALNRGVNVTCVNVSYDQQQCQIDFATQPGFKEHLGKNLNYVDFGATKYTFFHDKIYISENEAYIGGQNLSASFSIDAGVIIPKDSPLYDDIRNRAVYMTKSGNYVMYSKYTSDKPYNAQDSNTDYFSALSPYFPLCLDKQGESCTFPQESCDSPSKGTGKFTTFNNLEFGEGHVSYEYNHLINLIKNAKDFLTITNFDFSFYSSFFGTKSGKDDKMGPALEQAAKNGANINLYIHNAPINDDLCNGSATCVMLRCKESKTWLDKMKKNYSNFKIHWWYQNPADPSFNMECKTLHSKIYYSDYGFLISSSNMTPSYFGGTQDTGIAGVFHSSPPKWILVGVKNVIDILKDHSTSTYKGQKYTCDNDEPNFQTKSHNDKDLCHTKDGNVFCKNACAQCGDNTYGSCGNCSSS